MQIMTKRINALLLAVCLLAALVSGGAVAWAADSGQGGENSLTAYAVDPSNTDTVMKDDLDKANVQVDVYQVAVFDEASSVFSVVGVKGFEDKVLNAYLKEAQENENAAKYMELFSERAAKIVFSSSDIKPKRSDLPVGEKLTGLENGLYLLIPHGDGNTPKSLDQMTAEGEKYSYKYLASTVTLLDQGSTDLPVYLKPEKKSKESPEPESTTTVSVIKIWSDSNNKDNIRPSSVEVKLYVGSTMVEGVSPITLNKDNNWKGSWEDLPKYDNGEEIEYAVYETKTSVVTGTDGSGTYKCDIKKSGANVFTVTNTHTPTSNTEKSSTTTTGKGAVNTGDFRNLLPFYVIMIASGVWLLALAMKSYRRKNGR